MNTSIDYFPSKLAKGEQFCNRTEERKLLKRNIELARHTVLASPRRYGKSSLVHKIASETHISFDMIDLFLAHDDKTVIKRILTGISSLVSQLIPVSKKTFSHIQKYFSNFKISINAAGFGIELTHATSTIDSVDQVLDALKSLEKLAQEKNKKVLLFIDEFQDIINAENSKAIQGAIRHVAQDTSWIVFVFSGSSRRLLLDLFDDKNKPLYMLCDKILLDRMSSIDYSSHIQKIAVKKWNKPIHDLILNRIFTLTELHPFYINLLCNELWKNHKLPTLEDVNQAWLVCYETESRRFIAELEKLTPNQQDILKMITAQSSVYEPTSQAFLNLVHLPLSSIRIGIKSLLEKDMIHVIKKEDPAIPQIRKGQYRILDPLLAFGLRKYV